MNARIGFALGVVALGAAACSSDSNSMMGGETPTTGAVTYADIAPLLNEKCAKCHQAGGIGPFPLTSYADAKKNAVIVAAMTKTRTMPPYLMTHDGSCGDFEDSEALSDAQIDLIQKWVTGGTVEGATANLTPPKIPVLEGGTEYSTPTVTPVAQGGDLAQFDDYRCFLIDTSAITANKFITGYDVLPGRAEIVHHVVGFVIDPAKVTKTGKTNAQLMQELDAADPDRVGWTCFGQAGDGIEEESSPLVWAPGQGVVNYPEGMGVLQRPTDKLVVQIHYNLADPATKGLSDSTKVRFRYVDKVDRPLLFMLPDGLLASLFSGHPDSLRPGLTSVPYTWSMPMAEHLPPDTTLDVVAVMPHMHQRGKSIEMRFIDAAGNKTCQARIDNWNFHWQKYYPYKGTVPTLTSGSTVETTCNYDTSQDHVPVLPGWGTRNEMCLETLVVAPR